MSGYQWFLGADAVHGTTLMHLTPWILTPEEANPHAEPQQYGGVRYTLGEDAVAGTPLVVDITTGMVIPDTPEAQLRRAQERYAFPQRIVLGVEPDDEWKEAPQVASKKELRKRINRCYEAAVEVRGQLAVERGKVRIAEDEVRRLRMDNETLNQRLDAATLELRDRRAAASHLADLHGIADRLAATDSGVEVSDRRVLTIDLDDAETVQSLATEVWLHSADLGPSEGFPAKFKKALERFHGYAPTKTP